MTSLCAGLLGAYAVVLAVPLTRELFDVVPPTLAMALSALGAAALAIAGLALSDDRFLLDLSSASNPRSGERNRTPAGERESEED